MICLRTVKKFCKDYTKIENYEIAINDNTQTYDCHHRREITEKKTSIQLIEEKHYYNVPPEDLIFLTHKEHTRLHLIKENCIFDRTMPKSCTFKGRTHNEETKKRISETLKNSGKLKGLVPPIKGKHRVWNESHTHYHYE